MHDIFRTTVRLAIFSFSLCLSSLFSTPALADLNKVQTELASFKETSKIRLDNTRELLQKDIQALSARLDTQDKRFDALNSQIDQSLSLLSNLLSGLGIVLALGGLVGYFSAQNKAKKEARSATNEWFENNSNDIQQRINALQQTLNDLERKAESNFNSHMVMFQEQRTLTGQAMDSLQQAISETKISQRTLPEDAAKALSDAAMATKNKPENQFDFNDWNTRAFDSFRKNEKENAIQFWRSAADTSSATAEERAQALLNIGSTLGQLGRYNESFAPIDLAIENLDQRLSPDSQLNLAKALSMKVVSHGKLKEFDKALDTCNDLINRFGTDSDSDNFQIRIRIIETLFHKAISLDSLNRNDECLAVHEDITKRFSKDTNWPIINVYLNSLLNKIKVLTKVNRFEESSAAFDVLITEFGENSKPEIQKIISSAKNSKGFQLLCQAKENWLEFNKRRELLQQAGALFDDAIAVQPESFVILGNIAYSTHLLEGDHLLVRENLTKAILLGQQPLYDATLDDLEIHPVGEADDRFRSLLEEIWRANKKTFAKPES